MRYVIRFFVVCVVGVALLPRVSEAIPPFARKYNQPCLACHAPAPPRLNDFGQTFKEAGYHLGGGEEFAPAETLRFSDTAPIGIRVAPYLLKHGETATGGEVEFDIPHEVEMFVSDDFGPRLHFFTELEWELDSSVETKIGFTIAGYALGEGNIWFRAGFFPANEWLSLYLGSGHFRLTSAKYLYETGDTMFVSLAPELGSDSPGFAIYGRPSEPFWFDIAILEGDKNTDAKDIWGHVNYAIAPNWNLSVFGYVGDYWDGSAEQDLTRLGAAVRYTAPTFTLYGAYLANSYDVAGQANDGIITWLGFTYPFTELTYVDARWERIDSDDFGVQNNFYVFHIGHLLMQNVRTALEYMIDAEESDNNLFKWLAEISL